MFKETNDSFDILWKYLEILLSVKGDLRDRRLRIEFCWRRKLF
jgi:hypothetical protein